MKVKLKPMGYVFVIGILFWTNVWFNGLFSSIMFLIIVSSIIGIFLKITNRM